MKKIWIAIFLVLNLPVIVFALEIEAQVDRKNISANESINLTVSISGGPGDVDVSAIQDFKVVSTGSSTNIQIVNSKISKQISYTYVLVPLKKGRLTIPSLEVTSGGNVYRTAKIPIQVSDQPVGTTQTDELFAMAVVSEEHPFAGQQFIYTFKLYRGVQVANLKFQEPEFSGFTAKKIEKDKVYKTTLSGREYIVNELNYVLVPLKPGHLNIPPAVISCDVVYRKTVRRGLPFDPFLNDPFFGRSELKPRVVKSDQVAVQVKPLPVYRGDTEFSGLVGHIEMTASIKETSIKAGESATLLISLSGEGNIMDAEEPRISFPDGLKIYKDAPTEDIKISSKGIAGKKVFRMALVPVREGRYVIDPVKLTYFDTKEGKYKTTGTDPIEVVATPSAEKEKVKTSKAPVAAQPVKIKKKKVEFIGRDILPVKQDLDALENKALMPVYQFLILLLIPLFLFLAVKVLLQFVRKNQSTQRMMTERATRALKKADRLDVTGEEFLSCLYLALVSAIHSRAGTKGESLTCDEAKTALLNKGYSDTIAEESAGLLNQIEAAKYSGSDIAIDQKKELFFKISTFVKGLIK